MIGALALGALSAALAGCANDRNPSSLPGANAGVSAGGVSAAQNVPPQPIIPAPANAVQAPTAAVPTVAAPAVNTVPVANPTTAVPPTATTAPAPTAVPTATAVPAPVLQSVVVKMNDQLKFDPASLTIARGTTVVWTNVGTQPHTVNCNPSTAIKKADVSLPSGAATWDSEVIMGGQSFKHTFTVAGLYRYVCLPHEMMGMVASIQVT